MATTAVQDYRARYYDPQFGRFVNEDPLGFGGGSPNVYPYVGNNPPTFYDPFGLTVCVFTPLGAICTNKTPRTGWLEPKNPVPPSIAAGLTPDPPPAPPEPPCSCDNWLQRQNDELDERSWKKVKVATGVTSVIQAGEHWAPHWLERILPPVELGHMLLLEYDLWEIQSEVAAKYAHCH